MSIAMIDDSVVTEFSSSPTYAYHALVLILWTEKGAISYSWWLNNILLSNQESVQHLKRETETYFEYNSNSAREQIVWDAFEAYMRGI